MASHLANESTRAHLSADELLLFINGKSSELMKRPRVHTHLDHCLLCSCLVNKITRKPGEIVEKLLPDEKKQILDAAARSGDLANGMSTKLVRELLTQAIMFDAATDRQGASEIMAFAEQCFREEDDPVGSES